MPRKKKKFIDTATAVKFQLVHRSQRDPLQADDEAPQHVLQLAPTKQTRRMRKEEEQKFGVFYDDDYDYIQHLKDVKELKSVEPVLTHVGDRASILLPSSVFPSSEETKVGLLNKAAPDAGPKIDWDPDIVAALDDDFNFTDPESQLEDDFIALANQELSQPENNVSSNDDDDDSVECGSNSDRSCYSDDSINEFETKTQFTNYSMSSSVIRRNKGLTLLDDKFEKLFEEYADLEIGALDHEDIEGSKAGCKTTMTLLNNELKDTFSLKDIIETKCAPHIIESESESNDGELEVIVENEIDKWDCESILSTYSTLYNHPKLIETPIKLTKRAQIPADVLPSRGLTLRQIEQLNRVDKQLMANHYRPKKETPEEKKDRKQNVKAFKKERRQEKKANKQVFKAEKAKQVKEDLNNRRNMQGITLA